MTPAWLERMLGGGEGAAGKVGGAGTVLDLLRGAAGGMRGPVVPVPMMRGRALEDEERMAGVVFLDAAELLRITFSRWRGREGGYGTGGGGGNGG